MNTTTKSKRARNGVGSGALLCFFNFLQQLSLAPMSEKALKCQRRAKARDSQPEPHPVGSGLETSGRPIAHTR
jgi:hypothetical protein